MLRLGLAPVVCALALGCASSLPHMSLATQIRIDRETRLFDVPSGRATDDDAIVRVMAGGGVCSGALIDRDLVLTAQHCVVRNPQDGSRSLVQLAPGDVRIELGGDYLPWGRAGVVGIVRCPCWRQAERADVAVLVLERKLPIDVPILPARIDAPPREHEPILVSGFGTPGMTWRVPDTDWPVFSSQRSWIWAATSAVHDDRFVMNMHVYQGESGGPVVSASTGEIVGVVSHGTEGEKSDAQARTSAARIDRCRSAILAARQVASGRSEEAQVTAMRCD